MRYRGWFSSKAVAADNFFASTFPIIFLYAMFILIIFIFHVLEDAPEPEIQKKGIWNFILSILNSQAMLIRLFFSILLGLFPAIGAALGFFPNQCAPWLYALPVLYVIWLYKTIFPGRHKPVAPELRPCPHCHEPVTKVMRECPHCQNKLSL